MALMTGLIALLLAAGAADEGDDPRGCKAAAGGVHWLTLGNQGARQGEAVSILPFKAGDFPGAEQLVDPLCYDNWTVEPAGAGQISDDRRSIRIAQDAPVGETLLVRATIGEVDTRGRTRIIAREAVSLAGVWKETSAGPDCPATDPVLTELVFTAEGTFSVTWRPFEVYKDYWGPYSFDAASGRLVMTMEGGNHRPSGVDLEGQARLEGKDLVIEGVFFGAPAGAMQVTRAPCALRFTKGR